MRNAAVQRLFGDIPEVSPSKPPLATPDDPEEIFLEQTGRHVHVCAGLCYVYVWIRVIDMFMQVAYLFSWRTCVHFKDCENG